MKRRKAIITTLLALGMMLFALFMLAITYFESKLPFSTEQIRKALVSNIAVTGGEKALLAPSVFLIITALLLLVFRRKKPFSIIFLIYTYFMYMSILVFAHLKSGTETPVFIMSRINASRLPLLVILIVLEVLLSFALYYVTTALDRSWREKRKNLVNEEEALNRIPSRRKMRKKELKEARKREKEEAMKSSIEQEIAYEKEKEEEKSSRRFEKKLAKEEKKAEKERLKAEKRKKKEKEEEEDVESFSSETLEPDSDIPLRAVDINTPLSVPTASDIPRFSTIEHTDEVERVTENPRDIFRKNLELVEKEEEKDEDSFSVKKEEYTPKYDITNGSHFSKGGMLEATIESLGEISDAPRKNSSPIIGYEEKGKVKEEKGEARIAPSNLSKDHPRYKLFESLREKRSDVNNVSYVPSRTFQAEREEIKSTPYESTYIRKDDSRPKLSDRIEEKKMEELSSTPVSSLSSFEARMLNEKDSEEEKDEFIRDINQRSRVLSVSEDDETEDERSDEGRDDASSGYKDNSSVPSLDEKHKGKYPDADEEVKEKEQENEIYYSIGIGGLSSQDLGITGIRKRNRMHYNPPRREMLVDYPSADSAIDEETKFRSAEILDTMREFKVDVMLDNIVKGPTVTMFELKLAEGVPVSKVKNRMEDLKYALGVRSLRILAPVPGKQAVGIEVPNKKRATIGFKDMLEAFDRNKECKGYAVPMILGRTVTGEPVSIDVAKTPHMLIAGSTGSGKSVGINSLIATILYHKSPRDVRLIMVDPKVVELKIYNGIPHLLTPVITDGTRVKKVLAWLVEEMERRYEMISRYNVRNISGFNEKIKTEKLAAEKLPYIVLIMDEYADLMTTIGKDIEEYISRLCAMARAVGIHLVLATQRPSAEVVTGTIKNNIPTRIAFAVASGVNSKIILDEMGAEQLLGRGDMLYKSPSAFEPVRIQGAFLSDGEVDQIVEQVKENGEPDYLDESIFEENAEEEESFDDEYYGASQSEEEEYERAKQIVYEQKKASASYLQRRMKIGYNKAARYVDRMEEEGIIGPANGSKPREVLKMI